MVAVFVVWLFLMAVATLAFIVSGGDWTGYVVFTVMVLILVAMFYLLPRVSNWVEYGHWDARLDHHKDPRQDADGHPKEKR